MSQAYPDITVVDENDNVIGQMQWSEAEKTGALVRVSKVYIHDTEGNMLMQKRSQNVAIPGKWNEAAAGHVDAGETYEQAAYRELEEETGLSGIELRKFDYMVAEDSTGRRKFFTSYIGTYKGPVENYDRHESAAMEWWPFNTVLCRIKENPDDFTDSFLVIAPKAIEATQQE